MVLRQLNTKDAPFMLEWMHDNSVVQDLQTDFASKTIEDCLEFIKASKDESENLHLAIVDNNDEYLGTVSLKNIAVSFAEFAITVRSSAMGKGIAKDAMEKIIDIGFEEKDLEGIYWCVAPSNKRAIRFYDKNGYHRVPSETLNIRGVQRITDSRILLVSHYKRGKEEQNLQIVSWIKKLNTDILFLHSVA